MGAHRNEWQKEKELQIVTFFCQCLSLSLIKTTKREKVISIPQEMCK
jgi:hypothetical protein